MSNAQAASTFSVSLSSVKRYVEKAHRGESLAPKKRPGSVPKLGQKAMRLLEEDLTERPFVSLQEHCDYMEAISGISVSRSTSREGEKVLAPSLKEGQIVIMDNLGAHRPKRRIGK